jgi:hypothetical protein
MGKGLLANLLLAATTVAYQVYSEPVSVASAAASTGRAATSLAVSARARAAPPDSVELLKPFVPAGYHVLFTVAGDLNRDACPDRVVVLDTTAVIGDSTTEEESTRIRRLRRPLLLLLGEPGGIRYRLAARNYQVVDCADCAGAVGGDPFQQVVIKRGYFSVESYRGSAWRWLQVTTFKYNPADYHWYLHRVGRDSFHVSEPDKVTSSVSTTRDFGRIRFEQYVGDQ